MKFSLQITPTLAMQLFQVMRLGTAVLTGILLAKSGLPIADIGAWEMLLYIGTTLSFFWVNGLLQGLTPTYSGLNEGERNVFFFNVFLVFTAISVALFVLLYSGSRIWPALLTGVPELPHFQLYCWYLLFHLPSFPVEYFYLLRRKPRHIVAWGVVGGGLHLSVIMAPLFLGYGMETAIGGLVVLSVLKFAWMLGLVIRYSRWTPDGALIRRYLWFCAPLMLSTIVSNLMLLFDNWLVGRHYQDAGIFAVYRYGARELPLAIALVSALGSSMAPVLAQSLQEGLASIRSKSLRLMHLLFPLTILLLVGSKWLFPLVFNPDFAPSAPIFNIYLLTLASRVLIPAPIALSRGDSAAIFRVSLLEMAIKMMLGFLFIQWWGLEGLAWSVVLAFWVEKLGLMWVLRTRHHIVSSDWVPWGWYLFYTTALFGAYAVVHFLGL